MKLTWTFFPKLESKVTLEVNYVPAIDKTGQWGFILREENRCWVGWDCFKAFDRGDAAAKKDAFRRLIDIKGPYQANSLTSLLAQ